MPGEYGEIKTVTATILSGQPTSSGIYIGGYRQFSLFVPTLTSAVLTFIGGATGGTYAHFRNSAGVQISSEPPGGTGASWLDSRSLEFLIGFNGIVKVSANGNQGSARDFVWHLKG